MEESNKDLLDELRDDPRKAVLYDVIKSSDDSDSEKAVDMEFAFVPLDQLE